MGLGTALRRHGDAAIALVLAVLITIEVARWDFIGAVFIIPPALLTTGSLALRRSSPLLGFVLSSVGGALFMAMTRGEDNTTLAGVAALLMSLYSAGRYTRGVQAWAAGALVLVETVAFLWDDGGPAWAPGAVAFSLAVVGGPWAAGLALRLNHDRETLLLARNTQLKVEQDQRARSAVAAERARIARELHDVVSHAISVTVLQARGGQRILGAGEPEVRQALEAIELVNTQALGDMRRLLFLLRDADQEHRADPSPSLAQIDALIAQVRESGLAIKLSLTGDTDQVPPGVDSSAYRIVQEALTNTLKHAGPTAQAHVEVDCGEVSLTLVVQDNGQRKQHHSEPGFGLIGIRERVAVVGGRMQAGPCERGGFRLEAVLPYTVEG